VFTIGVAEVDGFFIALFSGGGAVALPDGADCLLLLFFE
jgi:hypothetical protein